MCWEMDPLKEAGQLAIVGSPKPVSSGLIRLLQCLRWPSHFSMWLSCEKGRESKKLAWYDYLNFKGKDLGSAAQPRSNRKRGGKNPDPSKWPHAALQLSSSEEHTQIFIPCPAMLLTDPFCLCSNHFVTVTESIHLFRLSKKKAPNNPSLLFRNSSAIWGPPEYFRRAFKSVN